MNWKGPSDWTFSRCLRLAHAEIGAKRDVFVFAQIEEQMRRLLHEPELPNLNSKEAAMTEATATRILQSIREEITRLETDIADGNFSTAGDVTRANRAIGPAKCWLAALELRGFSWSSILRASPVKS